MAKSSKSAACDIKRKITIPERYTDEPAGVAGSSSSAIPLLAHDDEDTRDPNEELPGYRDEEENAGEEPPPFTVYRPVVTRIRSGFGVGNTATVSHDPHLNSDGEALYRYVYIYIYRFFFLPGLHRYLCVLLDHIYLLPLRYFILLTCYFIQMAQRRKPEPAQTTSTHKRHASDSPATW